MKKKLIPEDIKSLIIKIPVEAATDISWNGETYELFDKEGFEQWKKKWEMIYDKQEDVVIFVIDVETGRVTNLPEGTELDCTTIKVVDCGEYTLIGKDGEVAASYEGYVPDCLAIGENGYGDYFEFTVDDSVIQDWKWNTKLLKQFLSECSDEDDEQ